jgi:hypothetical protein
VTLLPKILNAADAFTQQPSDTEMKELMTHLGCEPIFDAAGMIMA